MSNKGFAIFLAVVVLIGGLVGVVFAVGMSVGESKTDNKNQPLLNQNTDSNPAQTSLENSSEKCNSALPSNFFATSIQ